MQAADHIKHLSKILLPYGKSCADTVCLVGDNCAVDQSMARLLNVPLLARASIHRFNLAVRRWIAGQEPGLSAIIAKVFKWSCRVILGYRSVL
jgi:hypothetical protein